MNNQSSKKIAVLGGGSFGTVMANIIASNGYETRLWLRNAERAAEINTTHCNSAYLPDYALTESLLACTDLETAVNGAAAIFVAVPSSSSREVARALASTIAPDTIIVSTTKGIEARGFKLMSQVLREELPTARIAVLSGPNLAREIASGQLSGSVIASPEKDVTALVQQVLSSSTFRLYDSEDMFGVELGGALKNIYAIMAGIGAALSLGQNTMGMLLTRSLAEMSRFAVQLGANPMTFLGLSGVGDLFVTCSSPLSRNYQVGYRLGQGAELETIIEELGQVAEGVNTLRLVHEEAAVQEVYMPLVNGLYAILFEKRQLNEVITELMLGEVTTDVEFVTGV